ASWPRCARFRAARWPAMAKSPAAQDCRDAQGWWRGCWRPTTMPRCPGTAWCAPTVASRCVQAAPGGANSDGAWWPRACRSTRAPSACRAPAGQGGWTRCCGDRPEIEESPPGRHLTPRPLSWRDLQGARPLSNLPPVTKALLIINGVVFLLQFLLGSQFFFPFMLWPLGGAEAGGMSFMPWQLVSYGFLHAGMFHLLFNMLVLYMFGAPLEYTWGQRRFLTYFLVCVVGAGLCQLVVVSWSLAQGGLPYPTLGASGGVFGVLLAFGMLFPNHRVMLLIPPIPMKARTLVIALGVIELIAGISGT